MGGTNLAAVAAAPARSRGLWLVLRSLATFILWTALAFGLGMLAVVTVPSLFGYRSLTVVSGSMEPTLGTGSVVIDEVISRVTDVFLAFPALLLALAFAAVMEPSITNTVIAISVTWWPWYTRIVRGQAASVTGRPFVESAKATGVPHRRILLRHVLPNSITPVTSAWCPSMRSRMNRSAAATAV